MGYGGLQLQPQHQGGLKTKSVGSLAQKTKMARIKKKKRESKEGRN